VKVKTEECGGGRKRSNLWKVRRIYTHNARHIARDGARFPLLAEIPLYNTHFMHVPIAKVEIAIPKEKWRELLNSLTYWGNFHVEEYEGEHRFPLTPEEEEERKTARRVLSMISEVENLLGAIEESPVDVDLDYDGVKRIRDEVVGIGKDLIKLREEQKRLSDYMALSEALKGYASEGETPLGIVLSRSEIGSKALLINLIEKEGLTHHEVVVGDRTLIVVLVPEDKVNEFTDKVQKRGFTVLKPPKGFKEKYIGFLKAQKVDRDAFVKVDRPKVEEYERVPVALKNSPPLSWFQSLLDIYAPPVYKTFDPTVMIAIFFPLYYGFMLGDAGYGIVGMFLFWMLAQITKPGGAAHNLSMVYFIK